MKNLLYAFFKPRPWLAWVCIIILIRVIISFSSPQFKSLQIYTIDMLLEKWSMSEDARIKNISVETLFEAAKYSEEHRNYIIQYFRQKERMSQKISDDAKKFINKLESDPEMILRMALDSLQEWNYDNFIKAGMGLSLLMAFLICLFCPVLLHWWAGIRALHKVYGKFWKWLIAFFFILFTAPFAIWIWLDFSANLFLHLAWAAASFISFLFLLQSGTCAKFLDVSAQRAHRIFLIFCLILLITGVPWYLQYRQNISHQMVSLENTVLMNAIDQVTLEKRKSAVPILVRLLKKSDRFSVKINQHIIKALGEMGDEGVLSILSFFLYYPELELQIESLQSIQKVWQRSH